jgi:hypothetical protein
LDRNRELGEQAAQARPGPTPEENRGWIARWIIIAFLSVVIVVVLFIMHGVYNKGVAWADGISEVLDVLKSVLLPVVTLILGYYFGQSSKSGD